MTIGVLWEFFEYQADTTLHIDMQKDSIVSRINTVTLDETNSNKVISINDIDETIITHKDKTGNVVETKIDGYLDIGLIDTMNDLKVNLIGAVIFNIFGYLYVLNRDKYKFISSFLPKKLEL